MLNIMIRDLELCNRLDKKAMASIMGGTPITTRVRLSETQTGTQVDLTTGLIYRLYNVNYRTVTMDDVVEKERRPFI